MISFKDSNSIKLEDVIPELENLRTRILYDSSTVKDLIIFQHILPHYFQKSDVYIVLYSEALYYKFKKRGEYLMFKDPNMAKILDDLRIIKIGIYEDCYFGELFDFIKQGDPEIEFESLKDVLSQLKDDDVLILYGSMAYFMATLRKEEALKKLIEIYSILPDRITLFGFKSIHSLHENDPLISEFYDVIIRVQKDENAFDNVTFMFSVECQLSQICQKFGRFIIEEERIISL
jgi:hypothetical protein